VNRRSIVVFGLVVLSGVSSGSVNAQVDAVESITVAELRTHLEFIAADEFAGRNTPSTELKITSRYLATMVASYGFKPLMPDGSFLQNIPLEVTSISTAKTWFRLHSGGETKTFQFQDDFGISRTTTTGSLSGDLIFVGYGLEAPDFDWDDYGDTDLTGKVVVMLEGTLPEDHTLRSRENRRYLFRRVQTARVRGAAIVITVIAPEREQQFASSGLRFGNTERIRIADEVGETQTASSFPPYIQIEVRHAVGAAMLGVTEAELRGMFEQIGRGEQVSGRELTSLTAEVAVEEQTRLDHTSNVVAYLDGSDPLLKDEYVLFGAHHDHVGVRNGEVLNGADDNGSGTVAMLEIAQALILERPRRSVILVWHTGEEKGLWGASWFVSHSPVPVEKMSAELNMDMISRNDPDSLYVIGSDKLSTELDSVLREVNNSTTRLNLDYLYNDPAHPEQFFFRSDQFPFVRYGIPAMWFFSGTHPDYHRSTDTIDKVDYGKMERVTRLVYLVGMAIGNLDEMLKLDVHPGITTRGAHNLEVGWR